MTDYTVLRARSGWIVKNGVLTLEAESPHIDRGAIRAALTVREGVTIHFRDTANLTSERARARIVTKLADKQVELDDRLIVALDEACRRQPDAEKSVRGGGVDKSETVPHTLDELTTAFRRRLLINDRALLPVLVGAVLAHRLGGEGVWLMLVAPPGGTKSEVLRSFYGGEGFYPLSDLTARTFASGLDSPSGDPSLLSRLQDEVLVLKDFTTVLEMSYEERQAILAQLREIYDGRFDKAWGTGRELHWEGRLGFVAGVTPIIDRHQSAMSVLGERFVLLRVAMPNRLKMAAAALKAAGQESAMRDELATAMHGFLAAREIRPVAAADDVLTTLATVADFVTRARSGVIRDGYRRELEYAPEPEAPTRFAKVLHALACGIALAHDGDEVGDRELAFVLRVALDCLPVVRQRVIAALVKHVITSDDDGELSTTAIAGASQFSTATIRRTLEDLQALSVVVCQKQGTGKADLWRLRDEWRVVFERLRAAFMDTFSDLLGEGAYTTCWGCGDALAAADDRQCGLCASCTDAREAA